MEPEDTTPIVNKKKTKFIQKVTSTFLFYAQAVDGTMLMVLSGIASEQEKQTEKC